MARLALEESAWADLDQLADFLAAGDSEGAIETASLIFEALSVLERHPMIGRPVEEGLRELVISRGRSGYVALYAYLEAEDLVLVLAVRHQREGGDPASR
ncbi:MAG TPA: type II toxin-antitoxin system RelE/ParE family toxin [Burkholderiales bacterium]|nr:type II toxin-antitoxin system RelE/ParE family toxin [Burkholderiales bacterium]